MAVRRYLHVHLEYTYAIKPSHEKVMINEKYTILMIRKGNKEFSELNYLYYGVTLCVNDAKLNAGKLNCVTHKHPLLQSWKVRRSLTTLNQIGKAPRPLLFREVVGLNFFPVGQSKFHFLSYVLIDEHHEVFTLHRYYCLIFFKNDNFVLSC